MKRLLLIFILTFSFQSLTKADDIRDFQIEGIGIGDSLLDFFNKNKIKPIFYPKSKKFARSVHMIDNGTYEAVRINYKTKDKRFTIYGIGGMIKMNIEDCYKKERTIIKEIEAQFPKARKKPTRKLIHKSDSTGKSVYNFTSFIFNDGTINIECTDWSNDITSKRGWGDGLAVMINTNEYNKWLQYDAR